MRTILNIQKKLGPSATNTAKMWGANTFPTHNRLSDSKSGVLHTLSFFSIVFQNKLWWQLQTLFFQILFLVRHLVTISIAITMNIFHRCFIKNYGFVTHCPSAHQLWLGTEEQLQAMLDTLIMHPFCSFYLRYLLYNHPQSYGYL